jgi:hypothetical protein|tara:strand:- start:25 stop:471 length:447 start_codon:yes stop_codon:yes gene_type:complete
MAAIASFQLAAVAPACAKRSMGAKGFRASASSSFMGASLATPVRAGVARAAGASALKVEARFDAGVGVFGNKAGMTQIFTDEGLCIPVSVIAVQKGNVVTQVSILTPHVISQHVYGHVGDVVRFIRATRRRWRASHERRLAGILPLRV